jgi:hypothetical protein
MPLGDRRPVYEPPSGPLSGHGANFSIGELYFFSVARWGWLHLRVIEDPRIIFVLIFKRGSFSPLGLRAGRAGPPYINIAVIPFRMKHSYVKFIVYAFCRGGKPQRGRRIVLKIDHTIII